MKSPEIIDSLLQDMMALEDQLTKYRDLNDLWHEDGFKDNADFAKAYKEVREADKFTHQQYRKV